MNPRMASFIATFKPMADRISRKLAEEILFGPGGVLSLGKPRRTVVRAAGWIVVWKG